MTAPLAEPATEDRRTQQQDRNLVRIGRERKRLLGVLGLPGEFRDQIAEAVRIVANVRTLWRNRATDILGRLLMTGPRCWLRPKRKGCNKSWPPPAVRSLDLSASAALQGRATVLEPQNSRDLLLVLVRFILIFLSRMYLPRFGGAFLVWQRNQSPRPELLWFRECLLCTLSPAPHTQPEAGLFLQHDCERRPDIAEIPETGIQNPAMGPFG
jgi:hypothetical protein